MRTVTPLLLLFANAVLSAAVERRDVVKIDSSLGKRQTWGELWDMYAYGKVADPPGAAPRRVNLPTGSKVPGAKRVKIRSGPYLIPNMSKKIFGHNGMLFNHPDYFVERPCQGECTLLWQQAGLEYPNGTNANIDTNLWLHHMVQINAGPTRWDPAGWEYGDLCLPLSGIGTSVSKAERFYTAGNERTPFDYNPRGNGLKSGSGYHLLEEDKFVYLVEIMNMNMEDKVIYLTMTYDYLPGELPDNWSETKGVWLDANQCWNSEVHPPKQNGSFSIQSERWNPNFEGTVLSAMGHVHDGGVEVDIQTTETESFCKTQTQYSEKPEYIFRGAQMGEDKVATHHVSSMKGCTHKEIAPIKLKKGQAWLVKADYDYEKYEGNLEGGKQSDIMALGVILVQIRAGGVPRPRPVSWRNRKIPNVEFGH